MSWEEKIKYNVFDPRRIGANLIDWFKENQADALFWANGNQRITGAKNTEVLDFFENARKVTRFPVLMINRSQFQTTEAEDMPDVQIALEYEIILVHGSQDWLARHAPVFAMAFESMTKNVPKTRLEKDSKIIFDGQLLQIETTFDFLRGNGSEFMQSFTTQVNWLCDFQSEKE